MKVTRKQIEDFAALVEADEAASDLSEWRETSLRKSRQRFREACADLIQELERAR